MYQGPREGVSPQSAVSFIFPVPVHSSSSVVSRLHAPTCLGSFKKIITTTTVSTLWSFQTAILFRNNFLKSLSRAEPTSGRALRGYKDKI